MLSRQGAAARRASRRRWSRSTPTRPRRCRASIVVHDGDFVGVAAADERPPTAALAAIKAEWKIPAAALRARICSTICKAASPSGAGRGGGGSRAATTGLDRGRAWRRPTSQVEQTYTIAYIAHAPLEPRAAVAEWDRRQADRLDRHAAAVRRARRAGRRPSASPEDRVRVIVPDTGSGYGGKHTGEAAVEAARLAQGRGQAGQARLDPRGGVHLGLLPPGRRDRRRRPASTRTARSPPGSSTTTTRAARRFDTPYEVAQPAGRVPRRRRRRCARARTAPWPPRPTTSPASRTWTSWPAPSASTRSSSG